MPTILLALVFMLFFPGVSLSATPTVTGDCLGGASARLVAGDYAAGQGVNCAATSLVMDEVSSAAGAEVNLSGQSIQLLPTTSLKPVFRANTAITDPAGDLDGDGMSNQFEVTYGLAPGDASDAGEDPDGDGVASSQEYQDGTDPTDPNDFLALPDFHTPDPMSDILARTRPVNWIQLGSLPGDLDRFAMGQAGTSSLFTAQDSETAVTPEVVMDASLAGETSVSNDRLLRAIFQLIEESTGVYRIVSSKHFNHALDIDTTNANRLILRDIRSSFLDTANAGYLLFTLTSETDGYRLTASDRMLYNDATSEFEADTGWTSMTLTIAENLLLLANGFHVGLELYAPPLDLEIPFDFNPEQTARVGNPEVTPAAKGDDPLAGLPGKVIGTYGDQVAAKGLDAATTSAASAMLATIASDLSAEGASLRYSSDFYLAFRAGLLSRAVRSSDSMDMALGELTVPYVYFTNATDGNGTHHPFMVIASYGVPEGNALLWDVAKPPGDGNTNDYNTQSVTRSYHYEAFMIKIPLRDYGEVSSLTENDLGVNNLASDVGSSDFDHHNYASLSANGVAIDGIIIYPSYNNALHFAQSVAELSARGMHSGRGLGVHYHADSHGANHSGLNLYNDEDYLDAQHPPIVSMGFDGVAGYGEYASDDTTSDGVLVALDDFGGHEHDDYGYHYHAYSKPAVTDQNSVPYSVHTLPPQGAWAGLINGIPEFWDGTAPSYVNGNSVYLGTQ